MLHVVHASTELSNLTFMHLARWGFLEQTWLSTDSLPCLSVFHSFTQHFWVPTECEAFCWTRKNQPETRQMHSLPCLGLAGMGHGSCCSYDHLTGLASSSQKLSWSCSYSSAPASGWKGKKNIFCFFFPQDKIDSQVPERGAWNWCYQEAWAITGQP